MSRIENLVEQHAPDGVEYKPLSDLMTYTRGVTYAKMQETSSLDGYGLLRSNNIDLTSNSLDLTDLKRVRKEVRIRADQWLRAGDILISAASGSKAHVGKVAYIAEDLDLSFGGFMAVVRANEKLESRYLFHVLSGRAFADYLDGAIASSTINNLNAKVVGGFRLATPPLEVQREIVKVLDAFAGLGAELEAELEARRRQFAHYRDALLTFRDAPDVTWIPMGDFGTFARGRRFTKNDMIAVGIPSIHYGEIYTHYGVHAAETQSHVRAEIAGRLRYAQPGDVVIAGVGETVEDVAKAVAWLGDTEVAIHDDSFAFRSKADPTYIAYVMQTPAFQVQKEKYVARAKVKRVGGENLGKIVVPVPSLDDQRRIVGILNKFDALVNDLSSGLPAEIEARRQQYAYYRDRLLSFEEAVA